MELNGMEQHDRQCSTGLMVLGSAVAAIEAAAAAVKEEEQKQQQQQQQKQHHPHHHHQQQQQQQQQEQKQKQKKQQQQTQQHRQQKQKQEKHQQKQKKQHQQHQQPQQQQQQQQQHQKKQQKHPNNHQQHHQQQPNGTVTNTNPSNKQSNNKHGANENCNNRNRNNSDDNNISTKTGTSIASTKSSNSSNTSNSNSSKNNIGKNNIVINNNNDGNNISTETSATIAPTKNSNSKRESPSLPTQSNQNPLPKEPQAPTEEPSKSGKPNPTTSTAATTTTTTRSNNSSSPSEPDSLSSKTKRRRIPNASGATAVAARKRPRTDPIKAPAEATATTTTTAVVLLSDATPTTAQTPTPTPTTAISVPVPVPDPTTTAAATDPTSSSSLPVYPVGTRTKKYFNSIRAWFPGIVRSYHPETKFYSIEYEDGDREDLEHHEIDTDPLPEHKYDIGFRYEIPMVSKKDGTDLGWFVGTIEGKCYVSKGRAIGWRYRVVYSDGDSEDVRESYITDLLNQNTSTAWASTPSLRGCDSNSNNRNTNTNITSNNISNNTRKSKRPRHPIKYQDESSEDEESSFSCITKRPHNTKRVARANKISRRCNSNDNNDDDDDSSSSSSSGGSNNNSNRKPIRRRSKTKDDRGEDDDEMSEDEDSSSSSSENSGSTSDSTSDDNDGDDDDGEPDVKPKTRTKIPHWTGKEHDQFFVGLLEFGCGNLEDIHEAGCIPTRSYRELARYWTWYRNDMEQIKGIPLDYDRKGMVNGKVGTRWDAEDNDESTHGKNNNNNNNNNNKSNNNNGNNGLRSGPWTEGERQKVVNAYAFHGGSYKEMSEFMKTRNPKQVASYYRHHKKKIHKAAKRIQMDPSPNAAASEDQDGHPTEGSSRTISPAGKGTRLKARYWTPGEELVLAKALAVFGETNYLKASIYMKSRGPTQIKKHVYINRETLATAVQGHKEKLPKPTRKWSETDRALLTEARVLYHGVGSGSSSSDRDKEEHEPSSDSAASAAEMMAVYIETKTASQVASKLKELDEVTGEDEPRANFDLGYYFTFPEELYHVLNTAPYQSIDHVLSWNEDGESFCVHDEAKFRSVVFPLHSRKGTSSDRFYDSLQRFGFQKADAQDTPTPSPRRRHRSKKKTYSHPSFRRGDYKKVLRMPHDVFSPSSDD